MVDSVGVIAKNRVNILCGYWTIFVPTNFGLPSFVILVDDQCRPTHDVILDKFAKGGVVLVKSIKMRPGLKSK